MESASARLLSTKSACLGWLILLAICLLQANLNAAQAQALYENDFSTATVGKVPDEFMVIEGGFTVKEDAGQKFLELPPTPLGNHGVLFGPSVSSNVMVSVKIWGINRGKRYPIIGVGLNGIAGYKLLVAPGRGNLEIHKGDVILTSKPYAWQPNKWTRFRFQVRKATDGVFKLEGKVWQADAEEPKEWMVAAEEKTVNPPGRASIWGCPVAETAIRFDDLSLQKLAE